MQLSKKILNNTLKHFKGIVLLIAINLNAQSNLVPNPSFEQYINCPINNTLENGLANCPDFWYKPNQRSAVYWSVCSNGVPNGKGGVPYNIAFGNSYQYPKTGVSYMAMGYVNNDYNDYIQIKLFDSLKANKKYYGEYYVSLFDPCVYGCNNIAMLFTNNVVYADTINKSLLIAAPQIVSYGNPIIIDTMGWVKISSIFTAQGGEQYLTLGNFTSKANNQIKTFQTTGYFGAGYYVDDVSVIPLDSMPLNADAGPDTTIHIGDSAFIGSLTNGIDSIKWQILNTNGTIDSIRPGFWVYPTVNTCYVVTQTVNGFTSSDTVCVNVLPLPLKFLKYEVRISNGSGQFPSNGGVRGGFVENLWHTANEVNVSHFYVQRSLNGNDFVTIHKEQANNKAYNEYSFIDDQLPTTNSNNTIYYRILSVDKDGKTNYSEVRTINFEHQTSNITIFPNPAKDAVTINSKGVKHLTITDCFGRIVYNAEINRTSYILNLKSFANGIYIFSFDNGEKVKVVKE